MSKENEERYALPKTRIQKILQEVPDDTLINYLLKEIENVEEPFFMLIGYNRYQELIKKSGEMEQCD